MKDPEKVGDIGTEYGMALAQLQHGDFIEARDKLSRR